jgi:deoxyribonuclease V
MKVKNLHIWSFDYKEARRIQQDLAENLILDNKGLPGKIKTVAGADISYSRKDGLFFAAVILLEFPTMETIEVSTFVDRVNFPYIPGLLTFREGPALLKAFEKLSRSPDVVIFDGQGIAHPRGIGLASHIGLFIDIPAIGCAKKKLVGDYADVGNEPGNYAPLVYREKTIGAVLRTRKGVKPVFISQGHRIDLKKAIGITLSSCKGYRLPEPTRRAHITVNKLRLDYTA